MPQPRKSQIAKEATVHSLEQACQLFGRQRRPNLAVRTALFTWT